MLRGRLEEGREKPMQWKFPADGGNFPSTGYPEMSLLPKNQKDKKAD